MMMGLLMIYLPSSVCLCSKQEPEEDKKWKHRRRS